MVKASNLVPEVCGRPISVEPFLVYFSLKVWSNLVIKVFNE